MKRIWLLIILVALIVAATRSMVFVDETEAVIVTQFGRPVATYLKPGLQWKWPYQSALRIDRRLQIYDPRPSEFLAGEKKNIDLAVCVCWKVAEPMRFLETVNDPVGAEARLHDIVWAELAAEVGVNPIEALVSTDPELHELDELVTTVRTKSATKVMKDFGIELVDIRLKRISLPAQVRDSVFQRMRAERSKIARQYRAEGEEEAMKIRATADKDRTVTLAAAYAEAEKIRGQAEAEATQIYAAAHEKDPDFYQLLRTLEAYKQIFDEKTTILLSANSELFKYLDGGKVDNRRETDPNEVAGKESAARPVAQARTEAR